MENKQGNNPRPLVISEWIELFAREEIKQMWGVDNVSDFQSMTYAVHFDFVSGSPGYCGDLYLLMGDGLAGDPPLMYTRDENGKLVSFDYYDC